MNNLIRLGLKNCFYVLAKQTRPDGEDIKNIFCL
jgi:hypothetical protein